MKISGLDEIDNRIVSLLLKDGRMSFSDIGEYVGLSRVAVKNRIRAMESKGIIQGYKAIIDPQSAPGTATFILHVETAPETFEQAKGYLIKSPKVVTLVQTTGECHLLAVCVAPDVPTMREFVNTVYKDAPNVRRITAHSVLDIIKGSIVPDILCTHSITTALSAAARTSFRPTEKISTAFFPAAHAEPTPKSWPHFLRKL